MSLMIQDKPRHTHRPLLIILLGFTILSGIYIWLIPPFEWPDGPQHVAYIVWLVEGRGFPPQGEAAWRTPVQQEASQPPLYYLLAAMPARLVGVSDPPAVYRPNLHFPANAPGMAPDNKNIAIHHPTDTKPLRGGWLAIYLARGISLVFGIVLIVCIHGLAREVMPESPAAALAAALLVAATPQVIFLSSVVSNDILAAAMSTLTLWFLARLLRRGVFWPRALGTGVALGLAALSKTSALALGVPLAIGLVWFWLSGRAHLRQVISAALGIGLGACLVAGWWYGRAWVLYGSLLGLDTHCYAPWAFCDQPVVWSNVAERWREVFDSYWAAFGWGKIKFPDAIYSFLLLLALTAFLGLLMMAARWWRRGRPLTTKGVLLAIFAIMLVSQGLALEAWMQQVGAPYGRLLLPAIGAITMLLLVGWQSLHTRLGLYAWSAPVVLALLAPILLLGPAYRRPRPLSPVQIAELGEPIGWRFGHFAELHSVMPGEQSAPAGGVLPVRVCWRTLARPDQDYSVLLQIIGPNNSLVAWRRTYPGLGSYPTSLWNPNETFCDIIRVDIPHDLVRTLRYQIEIGWLDNTTGERLPAYDLQGNPLGHTFVSAVRLSVAEKVESVQEPAGAAPIRLLDYNLTTSWQPGQTQEVSLRWWVAQPVAVDYTVFIHLRHSATGQVVAQADGPPLMGWYPTSWWTAGEVVEDPHLFPLPAETPAGRYDLVVGWYDLFSGERMGEEYHLGVVEVGP